MSRVDDDIWVTGWLDRTYTGAPDECGQCWRNGEIVKISDCKEHQS